MYLKEEHFDILIGDEVYLEPNPEIKTACAYTKKYVEYSLKPNEQLIKQIDEIKNNLPHIILK